MQPRDPNSQPLDHQYPPITTRPRLPPNKQFVCDITFPIKDDRQTQLVWTSECTVSEMAKSLKLGINNLT